MWKTPYKCIGWIYRINSSCVKLSLLATCVIVTISRNFRGETHLGRCTKHRTASSSACDSNRKWRRRNEQGTTMNHRATREETRRDSTPPQSFFFHSHLTAWESFNRIRPGSGREIGARKQICGPPRSRTRTNPENCTMERVSHENDPPIFFNYYKSPN